MTFFDSKEILGYVGSHKTLIATAVISFVCGFLSRIAETKFKDSTERKGNLKEKVTPVIDVLKKAKYSFPQKIETKEIIVVRDLLSGKKRRDFDSVIDDLNTYNSLPRLDGDDRQKKLRVFFDEKVIVGIEKVLSIFESR